jgi:hypothetical protein
LGLVLRSQEPKKAMAGGWNWEKKGMWEKKGDAGKGDKEKKEWKGVWALEDDQQLALAVRASLEVQQATLTTMQQLVPLPILFISADQFCSFQLYLNFSMSLAFAINKSTQLFVSIQQITSFV